MQRKSSNENTFSTEAVFISNNHKGIMHSGLYLLGWVQSTVMTRYRTFHKNECVLFLLRFVVGLSGKLMFIYSDPLEMIQDGGSVSNHDKNFKISEHLSWVNTGSGYEIIPLDQCLSQWWPRFMSPYDDIGPRWAEHAQGYLHRTYMPLTILVRKCVTVTG